MERKKKRLRRCEEGGDRKYRGNGRKNEKD